MFRLRKKEAVNYLKDDKLPFFTFPANDESVSSWLFRLANLNYCNVQTFCRAIFESNKSFESDIDIYLSDELIKRIYSSFNVLDILKPNMLFSKKQLLHISDKGKSTWITNKIFNKKSIFNRQQICPSCIKKFGYYKYQWRLTFLFGCLDCNVYFINKCQVCGSEISFFKNQNSSSVSKDLIFNCYRCRFDLRNSLLKSLSTESVGVIKTLFYEFEQNYNSSDFLDSMLFFNEFFCKNYEFNNQVKKMFDLDNIPAIEFSLQSPIDREKIQFTSLKLISSFPVSIMRINQIFDSTLSEWKKGNFTPTAWTNLYLPLVDS